MEVSDNDLIGNCDWDLSYLSMIFNEDFNHYHNLWSSNMDDSELINAVEKLEIYSPIVEDISMDNSTLYKAEEDIENQ